MECHQSENDAATDLSFVHTWVCYVGKYSYKIGTEKSTTCEDIYEFLLHYLEYFHDKRKWF